MDQRLLFVQKLRSKQDFDRVFKDKRRLSVRPFLAYYRRNELPFSRIGIITAKRNVRFAVNRNRIRRVIRDQFRRSQHDFGPVDIVFLVNKPAGDLDNNELRKCLKRLLKNPRLSVSK